MKQKICPICDGKLGTGNFCPTCKKWVRQPLYISRDYYLNERHPKGEKDCDYHMPEYEPQKEEKKYSQAESVRKAIPQYRSVQTSGGAAGTSRREEKEKVRGRKKPAWLSVVIIIFIAYFLTSLISAGKLLLETGKDFKSLINSMGKGSYEVNEPISLPPADEIKSREHFNVDHETAVANVRRWLMRSGYEIGEEETYRSVADYAEQDENENLYDCGTIIDFSWKGEDDRTFDGYADINYDPVSGGVCKMGFCVESRESAVELLQEAGDIVATDLFIEEFAKGELEESGWMVRSGTDPDFTAIMGHDDEGLWFVFLEPHSL